MSAFHGKKSIKDKYVRRMKAHLKADQIVQGMYDNGESPRSKAFRGCAVGCTLHSSSHEDYETELGIPVELAYLHDACFEGLPREDAPQFALDFLEAIPVGADLSLIVPRLVLWMATDAEHGMIRFVKDETVKDIWQRLGSLLERKIGGENVDTELKDLRRAALAARDALDALDALAALAARAARDALAALAALDARAARDALAARAALAAQWRINVDKLLELLRNAPQVETVGSGDKQLA